MNPIEWLSWLYGKFFVNHTVVSYVIVCGLAVLVTSLVWTKAIENYQEQQQAKQSQHTTLQQISPPEKPQPLTEPPSARKSTSPRQQKGPPQNAPSIHIEQESEGPNSPNIIANQVTINQGPPKRVITQEARALLISRLSRTPSRARVEVQVGNEEALEYAVQLFDILKRAGWMLEPDRVEIFMSTALPTQGVLLRVEDDNHLPARVLLQSLHDAKIAVRGEKVLGLGGKVFIVVQVGTRTN